MYWDKKEHNKFEVSIKALIFDTEGKLLFAKDEKGKWDLPGGRIDANETVEECLKREVMEELGVKVKEIKKVRYAELIAFVDNIKRFSIGYVVEVESMDFKPSNENVENRFISKDEFEKLNQAYDGLKAIKEKLYD